MNWFLSTPILTAGNEETANNEKGVPVQSSRPANVLAESTVVPMPRDENETASPARLAHAGLRAIDELTPRVDAAVAAITEASMVRPSALPGWTRAHLVSHLARNADALVNLLTWARTGIERPAYASDEDRDADIDEGAQRLAQVIKEDHLAASGRFRTAAAAMPDSAWSGSATSRQGVELGGHLVPWMRVTELFVHLVDLDLGHRFADYADLGEETLDLVLSYVALTYKSLPEAPSMLLHATAESGTREHAIGTAPTEYEITGTPAELIAWLTGRTDGSALSGEIPALSGWLK